VEVYGRYFVSEIIYGAKFVCRYTLQGYTLEDHSYLGGLFESISSDIFFDESMSNAFMSKVEQAMQAKKLPFPDFQCSMEGGKLVPSPTDLRPSALGDQFHQWTSLISADNLVPQRARVSRITDLEEVQEAMRGMSSEKQAPLTGIQQITKGTTAVLELDFALAMFVMNSAGTEQAYQCASADQSLYNELSDLKRNTFDYIMHLETLNATGLINLQDQFRQDDWSSLKAAGFDRQFRSLEASCW